MHVSVHYLSLCLLRFVVSYHGYLQPKLCDRRAVPRRESLAPPQTGLDAPLLSSSSTSSRPSSAPPPARLSRIRSVNISARVFDVRSRLPSEYITHLYGRSLEARHAGCVGPRILDFLCEIPIFSGLCFSTYSCYPNQGCILVI